MPTIPDTNAEPATASTSISFSPEPFPRLSRLLSRGNSREKLIGRGLSSRGGRLGTSSMSIISRREGFLGLLVSACFGDIGLPQFQQNAYLSSIAEPQCWQVAPDG